MRYHLRHNGLAVVVAADGRSKLKGVRIHDTTPSAVLCKDAHRIG